MEMITIERDEQSHPRFTRNGETGVLRHYTTSGPDHDTAFEAGTVTFHDEVYEWISRGNARYLINKTPDTTCPKDTFTLVTPILAAQFPQRYTS